MSVTRHTFYNLCGSVAPLFVNLLTVPAYLHLIGNDRYGVLAIVWLFLGYFGLFDPGITRAATFHIARLASPERARERESVFWTAVLVNLALGVLGGFILYLAARPVFLSVFKMPESMRVEVVHSLPWLAASVPLFIVSGVLGGALEAREWFGVGNLISVANATLSQIVPLTVAWWHGPDLTWLISAVILTRAVGALPTFVALFRAMPLGLGGGIESSHVKSLFTYGGWITITNLLTPILAAMDRMLVGSVLNSEAVAVYTVPFNLASRMTVIPGALISSLFPRFSRSTREGAAQLASDSVAALAAVTTPLIVLAISAFPIFMQHWVGRAFAAHAAPIGTIILVGVWVNGLAFIPFSHLQAAGRPDVIAKFHLIELIPFLGMLWLGLHYFGLIGAALAWSLRVFFDSLLLFAAGNKIPGWHRLLPGAVIVVASACLSPTRILSARTALEIVLLAVAIVWSLRLSPAVRGFVSTGFGQVRGAPRCDAKVSMSSHVPHPRISVAMATYNGERYIREQLDSIARQTLQPIELVITDDGSVDATPRIVEEFARTAPFPVRFFANPQRLGYADNFLRAASHCQGDWIAFCDQDDIWLEQKLGRCSAFFGDPLLLLVAHSAQTISPSGEFDRLFPHFPSSRLFRVGTRNPFRYPYGFTMIIRTELLRMADNNNRPRGLSGHDNWFWFLAASAGTVATVADVLTLYRQHAANLFGAPSRITFWQRLLRTAGILDFDRAADHELACSRILAAAAQKASVWQASLEESAEKVARLSALHRIRAQIYVGAPSFPRRIKMFGKILFSGGYLSDPFGARLGPAHALKDLLWGIPGTYRLLRSPGLASDAG